MSLVEWSVDENIALLTMKSGKRVCISEIKVTNREGKFIATATGTTIPLV